VLTHNFLAAPASFSPFDCLFVAVLIFFSGSIHQLFFPPWYFSLLLIFIFTYIFFIQHEIFAHTWLFIADTCSYKTLETYSVIFPSTYWLKLLLPLANMTVLYVEDHLYFLLELFHHLLQRFYSLPPMIPIAASCWFDTMMFLHRFPIKNALKVCR